MRLLLEALFAFLVADGFLLSVVFLIQIENCSNLPIIRQLLRVKSTSLLSGLYCEL